MSKKHMLLKDHFIKVRDKTKDEVIEMLNNCMHRKHCAIAAEEKVVELTFQRSPPGMCPYFVLAGHPHTVNESSGHGTEIL